MPQKSVTLVELGCANTASVQFALERAGASVRLSSDPLEISESERLILPGVGHAGFIMGRIDTLGLKDTLNAFSRPMMGVCLGQQILFSRSEEGDVAGLDLLPGQVKAISSAPDRPVPHMGWSPLSLCREDPLLDGVKDGSFAYFVHSYACPVGAETLATATYGQSFAAMVRHGNLMGCQFHPERSSRLGQILFSNFLDLPC